MRSIFGGVLGSLPLLTVPGLSQALPGKSGVHRRCQGWVSKPSLAQVPLRVAALHPHVPLQLTFSELFGVWEHLRRSRVIYG